MSSWPSLVEFGQFSLVAFGSILFIVNPVAAIPTFLVLTSKDSPARRSRIARHAAWTCFIVLSCFALLGGVLFKVFGITLAAFRIAGGLLLLMISFEMLQGRRSRTQGSERETEEAIEKEDVGATPLGVPMLAGPGAISTVIVLTAQSVAWWNLLPVYGSIVLVAWLTRVTFEAAVPIQRRLGETGIGVLTRLMGLLLAAIAIQFVLDGLMASALFASRSTP
ncbi:MAG: MarC family protein [Candidatus Methylomirabilales bacterium]